MRPYFSHSIDEPVIAAAAEFFFAVAAICGSHTESVLRSNSPVNDNHEPPSSAGSDVRRGRLSFFPSRSALIHRRLAFALRRDKLELKRQRTVGDIA
jgi:hypothetical protein